jgi:hypothetical protein
MVTYIRGNRKRRKEICGVQYYCGGLHHMDAKFSDKPDPFSDSNLTDFEKEIPQLIVVKEFFSGEEEH